MVAGLPLAMAFLLRSLGRPRWPAVLAIPFAYGDSFGWGFVNSSASFALALLAAGLFVRALVDAAAPAPLGGRPTRVVLLAVVLMHVQGFLFLALALPFLLLTTRVPEDATGRTLRPRLPALLSTVPGGARCSGCGARGGCSPRPRWRRARRGRPGARCSRRGTCPSSPSGRTSRSSPRCSPTSCATARTAGASGRSPPSRWSRWACGCRASGPRTREAGGALAASSGSPCSPASSSSLLPFDIRGAIYYLNTRYAHLAAPLAPGLGSARRRAPPPVAARRRGAGRGRPRAAAGARLPRLRRRGRAAPALRRGDPARTPHHGADLRPRLTRGASPGVPPRRGGAGATARRHHQLQLRPDAALAHPVPRHPLPRPSPASGVRTGSAGTPWAPAYDHFLVRGVDPGAIFGARLGTEVTPVDAAGGMAWLENGPMNIDELAEALRGGESAPENVLGEDWEPARRLLAGETVDAGRAPGGAGHRRARGRRWRCAVPAPPSSSPAAATARWPRPPVARCTGCARLGWPSPSLRRPPRRRPPRPRRPPSPSPASRACPTAPDSAPCSWPSRCAGASRWWRPSSRTSSGSSP